MKIAGKKTNEQWNEFQKQLVPGENENLWREAYEDYFFERLKLRYFDPIKQIAANPVLNGEGFSIMAILCTLVEFLESTRQGKDYKYWRPGKPALDEYEYYESKKYFTNFLRDQSPFDEYFNDNDLRADFYEGVRCGLLHEARTKNGWKIRVAGTRKSSDQIIDAEQKLVYWDNFKLAFDRYLDVYKGELISDAELQKAFHRKLNSLCNE